MGKRGNGEGSIYYSEKLNRWVGQFTAGYKANGKLNRKTIYGKTRIEVKDKLNKELVNVADNKYVDKSNLTLIDIINNNLDEQYNSNKISANTYRRKLETKRIIENNNISNIPMQKITNTIINDFLFSITNYSNSVISKVSQMIKCAFDKAIILNIITTNHFLIKGMVIVPKSDKQDKKIDALTIEEQKLFISELEKGYDKYTDIFYMALFTGMRIGEILTLKKDDIDLNNNIIHVTKTLTKDINDKYIIGETTKTYAGTREIPITNLIFNILNNAYNNKNDLLFTENNSINLSIYN